MLQYDQSTPTQLKRLRDRAYCIVLLVAALSISAVFLLPALLP